MKPIANYFGEKLHIGRSEREVHSPWGHLCLYCGWLQRQNCRC